MEGAGVKRMRWHYTQSLCVVVMDGTLSSNVFICLPWLSPSPSLSPTASPQSLHRPTGPSDAPPEKHIFGGFDDKGAGWGSESFPTITIQGLNHTNGEHQHFKEPPLAMARKAAPQWGEIHFVLAPNICSNLQSQKGNQIMPKRLLIYSNDAADHLSLSSRKNEDKTNFVQHYRLNHLFSPRYKPLRDLSATQLTVCQTITCMSFSCIDFS